MGCVFCGSNSKLTLEHAWPQWLATVRPDLAKNKTSSVGAVGEPHENRPHGPFGIKVRCVCEKCNAGWMSDIETIVQPILTRMLKGESRTLYSVSQQLVATWAFKTALMLREATYPRADEERDRVPSSLYRHLYNHAVPPGSVTVWLAGYVGSDWSTFFRETVGNVVMRRNDDIPDRTTATAYGQVLLVGNLIFQVFGHTFPPDVPNLRLQPRGVGGKRLIRIWPTPFDSARVDWPPSVVLDDPSFDGFVVSIRRFLENLPRL
jgi:hypothetical protein